MHVARPLFGAVVLACTAAAAAADAWYPAACLGAERCARIEAVAWSAPAAGGAKHLVVTTAGGTAAVRGRLEIMPAGDEAMHVCMRYDPFGDLEVTCLMLPHNGS